MGAMQVNVHLRHLRTLDTLKFFSMDIYLAECQRQAALELLKQGFLAQELEWAVKPPRAEYNPVEDIIFLTDDRITDIVHELSERDMVGLIGYAEIGKTYVSHIMSIFKGGDRGTWRVNNDC